MIFLLRSIRVFLDFFVIVGWFKLIRYIITKIFTAKYNNEPVDFPFYYVLLGPVISLVSAALFIITHICFQKEMQRRQTEFYRQRMRQILLLSRNRQKNTVVAA